MEPTKDFDVVANSKHYVLATGEYFGMGNPRYKLLRCELQSNSGSTLFLMGIDLVIISTKYTGNSNEEVSEKLYAAATQSIVDYMETNEILEGSTYYGEYLENETFEISQEKPGWEDGNWGQRYQG